MFPLRSNTRLRRLVASALFCAIALGWLAYAGAVLKTERGPTDGGAAWKSLLSLRDDSLDVVFFGSSHAFCGVDPSVIWRERGIPTFVHAGPTQTPQVTYWYMRETLRTQQPEVIALEMTSTSYGPSDFRREFHVTNVGRMPLSVNKLGAAVFASPPDMRVNILVDVWSFHSRWTELGLADFDIDAKETQPTYLKGFLPDARSEEVSSGILSRPPGSDPDADAAIAYNADTLREIGRLCVDNDVELLLFVAPTGPHNVYSYYLDEAAALLEADGVRVHTLDLSDPGAVPGLDFTTDFRDGGHLNIHGAEKTSLALGEYLSATFALPDRRGDAAYASWTRDLAAHDAYLEELEAKARQ